MQKLQKHHHLVTENGNLQLRIITEYQDDKGKTLDRIPSLPMAPADTSDMTGWDDRSKDIVAAITDSKVLTDFALERLANGRDALEQYKIGLATLVDYDRTIEEDGKIAVRRIIRIYDDGVEVSKKYRRSWIIPGDDPSKADVMSKALAVKLHTPEVVTAFKAKMVMLNEKGNIPLILAIMLPPQIVALTFVFCEMFLK